MALKYFFPKKIFTYAELNMITGHLKGYGTSMSLVLDLLEKQGLEVVNLENFNYSRFAGEGEKYCAEIWSPETLEGQKQLTDLAHEQRLAKVLLKNKDVKLIYKVCTIEDVIEYNKKGYILMVAVNPHALRKEEGYWSHLVVVTEVSKTEVTFHEPGLPPVPNRKVTPEIFAVAMTPPRLENTGVVAVRFKQ